MVVSMRYEDHKFRTIEEAKSFFEKLSFRVEKTKDRHGNEVDADVYSVFPKDIPDDYPLSPTNDKPQPIITLWGVPAFYDKGPAAFEIYFNPFSDIYPEFQEYANKIRKAFYALQD